ncbi:hypothetical protein [Aquicoccus porphyridii]|uniref:hypothetical protein n=1 Tax=Aquicoccus porphyridii TaxID=1852029 RepID=UPI00273E23AC|nr:hypothetical protein [Aquicoccus porphyridii]
MSKIFTYEENGLSYIVTVYEDDNGGVFADITVNSGHMDVNAIYLGDDDVSGESAGLKGPLNMNGGGAQYEGEQVQWDSAMELSRPGLGRDGEDKDTYLAEGDSLTVELDVESIEDVDFFGIRATSTSTPEGSIKAVSGEPEEEEEEEEEEEDDAATYDKVFFVQEEGEGTIAGDPIIWENLPPEDIEAAGLEPDAEGTFANYVAVFEEVGYFDIAEMQDVRFYETTEEGHPREIEEMRLTAPEDGFEDGDALVAAYEEMIAELEETPAETSGDDDMGGLIMSLISGEEPDNAPASENPDPELEEEPALL